MKQLKHTLAIRTVALAALISACGSSTTLEGSLSQDVSLAFDQVQLQQTSAAVALVYMRAIPMGTGSDIVFKLTCDTTGLDVTAPIKIDLTQLVGVAERGQAERLVSGDTRNALPPISRGSLNFSQGVKDGASVSGSFNVLFANTGAGTLGEGETVFGNFTATVMEAQ